MILRTSVVIFFATQLIAGNPTFRRDDEQDLPLSLAPVHRQRSSTPVRTNTLVRANTPVRTNTPARTNTPLRTSTPVKMSEDIKQHKTRAVGPPKKVPAGGVMLPKVTANNQLTHSIHSPIIEELHHQPVHHRSSTSADEIEKAEKANKNLEKMIQFMTVLGQVDHYITSRARSLVTTLGRAMENHPDDRLTYPRESRENVKSCSGDHSHD